MVTCRMCERTILLGEAFQSWRPEGVGSEVPVCALCEEQAEAAGWVRVETPPERRTTVGPTWHARKVA